MDIGAELALRQRIFDALARVVADRRQDRPDAGRLEQRWATFGRAG